MFFSLPFLKLLSVPLLFCVLFPLQVIVVHFYCKDDAAACAGDGVCDEHGPDDIWLVQQSLKHKGKRTYCHEQECGY